MNLATVRIKSLAKFNITRSPYRLASLTINAINKCSVTDYPTGRQLPPLSSVLYGIISRRRSVLAAQLLLREKSGA